MPNFFPADFIDYKNMNSYAAVHYKNLNPYAAVPPPAALVLVRPGVPAPSPGGSGTRALWCPRSLPPVALVPWCP